jgi:ParB-like chromosome segregation protein Spo0J
MQFIEKLEIDKVKLWDKNPRYNDEAAEKLAKLLKKHGFIDPIIIDQDYIVRAGNTRVKAAKLAGIEYIPAIMVNFKNEQAAEAYSIADNKANEWAQWDYLGLKEIIGELDSIDFDLEMTGFDLDEMGDILTYEKEDKKLVEDEKSLNYEEKFQIVIECKNEEEQEKIFNKLKGEYKCRILTL